MKKTHKKILGLFGLVFVVAMTVFATFLPSPGASALSTMTDHITVVVLGDEPTASIDNPDSGDKFLTPDQVIEINYGNIKSYRVVLTYTDENGVETTATIIENNTPAEHGPDSYNFRSIAETYGYGTYVFRLEAVGNDDSALGDAVEFEYVAIEADSSSESESGNPYVDLDFDEDQDSLTEDLKIDQVVITVYDKDGNPVEDMPPIVVKPPVGQVEIPFDDYGIPAGEYTLVVQPFNAAGDKLFETIAVTVEYDGKKVEPAPEEEDIVVPSTADTGGLFKNLNISKSDYLITGLGLFLIVGISSIVFISKHNRSSKRRK